MRQISEKRREVAKLEKDYLRCAQEITLAHLSGDAERREAAKAAIKAAEAALAVARDGDDTAPCLLCGADVDLDDSGVDKTILTVRQLDHRRGGEVLEEYFARHEHFRLVFCGPCGDVLRDLAHETLIHPPDLPQ